MNIEFNITKRDIVLFTAIAIIFSGIFTYAYSSSFSEGNAEIAGHSADEVNIAIPNSTDIIAIADAQSFMMGVLGSYVCNVSKAELRDYGCPEGSYVLSYSDTYASQCRYFFSSENNSQGIPNCYTQAGGGGTIDYGGCTPEEYRVAPECCGSKGGGTRNVKCR